MEADSRGSVLVCAVAPVSQRWSIVSCDRLFSELSGAFHLLGRDLGSVPLCLMCSCRRDGSSALLFPTALHNSALERTPRVVNESVSIGLRCEVTHVVLLQSHATSIPTDGA